MRVSQVGSRAIGLGLVFAMAGFTLAITMDSGESDALDVSARAVGTNGTPLHFTNPKLFGTTGKALFGTLLIPGTSILVNTPEYDLGDALFGSAIVRYVTAAGGVKPYRFTSENYTLTDPATGNPVTVLSLANAILNTSSTLTLGVSGIVAGKAPISVSPSSQTFTGQKGLRFNVGVTDAYFTNTSAAKGTNSNPQFGNFNLTLYDSATAGFRFAVDSLPAGLLATPYISKIEVLGGRTPVVFSTVSVTNKLTGVATTLSALGMFLATNGSFYGRPLNVGTYTIVVKAKDNVGATARSRNAMAFNQSFDLVIEDNRVTSSDTMTTLCSVSGDTSRTGGDLLSLKGLINAVGQDNFNLLNSDFSFQLGNIGFSGRLDKHGKFVQNNGGGSKFTVNINARAGTITIRAVHGTFISGFDLTGVTATTQTVDRPLKIVIGNAVNSTEVIRFTSSVSGTSYAFNFALGLKGANATGGFQIISVHGRDDVAITGASGDAWRVGFVAQPRLDGVVANPNNQHEGIDNVASINVRIGGGFAQLLTGPKIVGAGPKINFAGQPTDGIQSFKFDSKSAKGMVTTRVLSSKITGIPTAANAVKTSNIYFPLGLDIKRGDPKLAPNYATFIGEHARRIFGSGSNYTDKPPARQVPGIF